MGSREYPLKWPEGWPRQHGLHGELSGDRTGRWDLDRSFRRLENEIASIPAKSVVLSSNWGSRVKENGPTMRADPGVAVYFVIGTDQLVMAQDAYRNGADNARSLAIAINGMRALKRHGGDMMMKRAFSGFAALPPPSAGPIERQWWEVLGIKDPADYVGLLTNSQILALAEQAYRSKAKEMHADAGGSDGAMAEVNVAIEKAREALAS
jgi:hypothetical protein